MACVVCGCVRTRVSTVLHAVHIRRRDRDDAWRTVTFFEFAPFRCKLSLVHVRVERVLHEDRLASCGHIPVLRCQQSLRVCKSHGIDENENQPHSRMLPHRASLVPL